MKVLFHTNIPSPYRVDFFNALGQLCDLTVTFEGTAATDRDAKWQGEKMNHFTPIFLKGLRVRSDGFLCWGIRAILKEQWDHIVIGGYSTPTAMLAIAYLRSHKRPFFIEVDGGLIGNDRQLIYKIKRHFLSSATGWFSSGQQTTAYLVHYGAQEAHCFFYPFSSVKQAELDQVRCFDKLKAKQALGLSSQKMVLSVGQFIPRKGFDILLKAAARLPQDVQICIVGGIVPEVYTQLTQELELSNVQFVAFQTKQELARYYYAADCFVLPTREDIWGLVINEAMLYGLPIVTTNRCVAGMELVRDGENGYLVPVEDPDALAQALALILEDEPLAIAMGNNSRHKIMDYTIEKMAQAHMDVFAKETGKWIKR